MQPYGAATTGQESETALGSGEGGAASLPPPPPLQDALSSSSAPIPPMMRTASNNTPLSRAERQADLSALTNIKGGRHSSFVPYNYDELRFASSFTYATAAPPSDHPQVAAASQYHPYPLFIGAGGEGEDATALATEFGVAFFDFGASGGGVGGGDCGGGKLPAPLPMALQFNDMTTGYSPPESTASGVTFSSMPFDFASDVSSLSAAPSSIAGGAPLPGEGEEGSMSSFSSCSVVSSSSRDPSPLYMGQSAMSVAAPTPAEVSPSSSQATVVKPSRSRDGDGGGGENVNNAVVGEYVCLVYQCQATFPRAEDLELHARTAHQHACLWGSSGGAGSPCDAGAAGSSFATREELTWHVKKEHLLVCPVLGCRESAFPSPEAVNDHLKWAHGADIKAETTAADGSNASHIPASNGLPRAPPATATAGGPSQVDMPASPRPAGRANNLKRKTFESPEDRTLKMQMSIGISKKRCREQLRTVVEKRYKRMNGGGTARTADSPGAAASASPSQISKLVESASFPLVWEHGVLPFLIEFMPKWCGPGHVISVVRGSGKKARQSNMNMNTNAKARRICIMTEVPVSRARRLVIAGHVRELLGPSYRDAASFVFSTGDVDRLRVWARGLNRDQPDEVCEPRNPFCYLSPCMGDSIGATLAGRPGGSGSGDEVAATLGPCLTIAGNSHWLVNFHPFIEGEGDDQCRWTGTEDISVEHPSPIDRAQCLVQRHDVLSSNPRDFRLGALTATSGLDLKTTRVSHDAYWDDCDKEPPLVMTDWALVTVGAGQEQQQTRQANILRKFPSAGGAQRKETPITTASAVTPGAVVCSTGRTSGHQRGMVCEVPAYMSGTKNTTGKATREWFIEEEFNDDDEEGDDDDAWIRGGIGVPGDSGAGVVDAETHALVGQLWGRNRYYGSGPRHAYFTPILDVIDDIQEKCQEPSRPQLPQYREEAECWPAYPVCRPCFDLREYLESRRGSRESLLSMIGCGSSVGRDHDLTSSISELATPKEHVRTPRETAYLVRHVGAADDMGALSFGSSSSNVFSPASLNSVVSPAPVHTFYPAFTAKSPGAVAAAAGDGRSPYAQTLDEEDLFDTKPLTVQGGLLGNKRPHMAGLARSSDDHRQGEKRRRT
ncbi:hypothetical protein SLS62_003702 [Diatrype stigma]|uniref:C2H2-type domain-containing protein n=1 Tax=Diatrype stigma TaxID=117547 RepID=A0AAN9V4M8_9PEZI